MRYRLIRRTNRTSYGDLPLQMLKRTRIPLQALELSYNQSQLSSPMKS